MAKAPKAKPSKPAAAKQPAKPTARKPVVKTTAQLRAERERYKVSPLRGMAIDDWLASKSSGWQQDVIRRMVAIVKAVAPQATVAIKWSQPVFELGSPFAFIKPAKAHLSFGFWRGLEVADPKGLLQGGAMNHFKLTAPEQLDEPALRAMVKDAVRLHQLKHKQ